MSAAALAAIALTVAILALANADGRMFRTVGVAAVCLEVLLALGAMSWFVRNLMDSARALERQREELAQSVAEAQEAQARAENEASQKARLAALLDGALANAPVAFAFFDRQLRFLRVNSMLAEILDVPPEDHIGETLPDVDPQLAKSVEPFLRRVLSTRRPVVNVEFRLATPGSQGEARDWLSSYYPIINNGELFAIGLALTDVTEVKRLEEQLLQAQKMEAVGRLAGGVAHDFNNLLTVISSFAELALFDAGATSRNEIEEIRGAAARAAKLTKQLLAFSRRQVLEPRIVNPNDVLRGVETLLRRLVVGNVAIGTELSSETPLVRVDPGQLEQVVMNLAINAADAMTEGGQLTIQTSRSYLDGSFTKRDPDLQPGPYALIRVRDTGHGMDAETVAQIFEPFFTTKEPGRGTGLGLSTVYGIVKQSRGHIDVESIPGTGTVFTVYFPAVDEPEASEFQPVTRH